jgi:hypothetical protein
MTGPVRSSASRPGGSSTGVRSRNRTGCWKDTAGAGRTLIDSVVADSIAAQAAKPAARGTRQATTRLAPCVQTPVKKATTAMKKSKSGSKDGKGGDSPSQLIDARIKELSDWRGEMLARVRILIKQADPEVVEEWKWGGVPVWSHAGIICTGETYKNVVKMTFAKGASLEDPSGLFNSSLEGNTRRAIDFHEGDKIDEKALVALIRSAVARNTSSAAKRPGRRA